MLKKIMMLFTGFLFCLGVNAIAGEKVSKVNNTTQSSNSIYLSTASGSESNEDNDVVGSYTVPEKFYSKTDDDPEGEGIDRMYDENSNQALNEYSVPTCSVASNLGMIGYVLHHDVGYYSYFEALMSSYIFNSDGTLKKDLDSDHTLNSIDAVLTSDTSTSSEKSEAGKYRSAENSDLGGSWSIKKLYSLFENEGLFKVGEANEETNFNIVNSYFSGKNFGLIKLDKDFNDELDSLRESSSKYENEKVMGQLCYHSLFEDYKLKNIDKFKLKKYPKEYVDKYDSESDYETAYPHDKDISNSDYRYDKVGAADTTHFKSDIIKAALDKGEVVMIMMNYIYAKGSFTGHQNSYCKYDSKNRTLKMYTDSYAEKNNLVKNTFDLSKMNPIDGIIEHGYSYNTASHCVFIFGYAQNGDNTIFMARNSWGSNMHDKGNSYLTADFIDGKFQPSSFKVAYPIVKYALAMRKVKSSDVRAI